jgi:hypothetical protein
VFLLDLEYAVPIRLFCDLDSGLAFSFFVFKGTVEEDDPRPLDPSTHLGMCDVLVEHNAIQHGALLDLASRYLLHPRVSLQIDLSRYSGYLVGCHDSDGAQGKSTHEVGPARDKFCPDGRFDEGEHLVFVVRVDGDRDRVDDLECIYQGSLESADDDDRVNVALQMGQSLSEDLAG